MAKKTTRRTRMEKRNEADFHESLAMAPASVLSSQADMTTSTRRLPIGIIVWALATIVAGVVLGLLIRAYFQPTYTVVHTGTVAIVADPPFGRVLDAKTFAAPLATVTNIQVKALADQRAATLTVQPTSSTSDNLVPAVGMTAVQQPILIDDYQAVFSSYGLQGSVGTAARTQ